MANRVLPCWHCGHPVKLPTPRFKRLATNRDLPLCGQCRKYQGQLSRPLQGILDQLMGDPAAVEALGKLEPTEFISRKEELEKREEERNRNDSVAKPRSKHSTLTFGVHKGKRLDRIPRDYLEWIDREEPRGLHPGQLDEVRQLLGKGSTPRSGGRVPTPGVDPILDRNEREKEANRILGPMLPGPEFGGDLPPSPQPVAVGSVSVPLESICCDGGTQARTSLDPIVTGEYAEALRAGASFPPVIVFQEGEDRWLADGFHRAEAYKQAGREEIPAEVRRGNKRDAILYAVGANAAHGLRRTNADKRQAVETLLKDEEWSKWSDRKIADQCKVSHTLVRHVRGTLSGNGFQIDPRRTVQRGDTAYVMDTAQIGATQESEASSSKPGTIVVHDGVEYEFEEGADPEEYFATLEAIDTLKDQLAESEAAKARAEAELQETKAHFEAVSVTDKELVARVDSLMEKVSGAPAAGDQRQPVTTKAPLEHLYHWWDRASSGERQAFRSYQEEHP